MSTITAPSVPFDALQRGFAQQYQDRDPLELDEGTVVVVPSLTFPVAELRKIVAIQHYEERLLYLLLLLGRPGVQVVYLSSLPIDPASSTTTSGSCPILGTQGSASTCSRWGIQNLGRSPPRCWSAPT